jgi:hypothetical protein
MPGFFVFIPWIDARRAGVPEGVFEVAKSLIPLVFQVFLGHRTIGNIHLPLRAN